MFASFVWCYQGGTIHCTFHSFFHIVLPLLLPLIHGGIFQGFLLNSVVNISLVSLFLGVCPFSLGRLIPVVRRLFLGSLFNPGGISKASSEVVSCAGALAFSSVSHFGGIHMGSSCACSKVSMPFFADSLYVLRDFLVVVSFPGWWCGQLLLFNTSFFCLCFSASRVPVLLSSVST